MTNLNQFLRIRSAIFRTPWAILPSRLDTVLTFLEARAQGVMVDGSVLEEVKRVEVEAAAKRSEIRQQGVAVIPINGMITHRGGGMEAISGNTTSVVKIIEQTRQAIADPNVSAVIHHYDSPGGTVNGVPEGADAIRAMRGEKPIIAMADTLSASAAYFLAASADEIVVTPSGDVGSIGVFVVHEDFSEKYKALGEAYELIASAKYKGEGTDWAPMTDEYRAYLEDRVLAFDDMFVRAVATGRGVSEQKVRTKYGQGRLVMAKDAKAEGMVDRVDTFDNTLDQLLSGKAPGRKGRRASASPPSVGVMVSVDDSGLESTRAKLEEMEIISARIVSNVAEAAQDKEPAALDAALNAMDLLDESLDSGEFGDVEALVGDLELAADRLPDRERKAHAIDSSIAAAYAVISQNILSHEVGPERASIAAANVSLAMRRRRFNLLRGRGPGRAEHVH